MLLVVALVGLSACSDAHSQAQLDLQNQGYDPGAVVILAPSGLAATLKDLGAGFTRTHPGTSFILVSDVIAGLKQMVRRGPYRPQVAKNDKASLEADLRPQLWVDGSAAIHSLLPPGVLTYGPPTPFGFEQLTLVVRPGNPDHVSGLAAFAKGSGLRTGICLPHTICGALARASLAKAHVVDGATVTSSKGGKLIAALTAGHLQAALTTSSEAADAAATATTVGTVPIPPELASYAGYTMVRLDVSQVTAEFVDWLTTSPAATLILANHGFTRTIGGRA